MSLPEAAEAVAQRVVEAIANGRAIPYASGIQDKENPNVTWSIVGLPDTHEIAVVARVGELRLGRAEPSSLYVPAMEERVFGIDVADQQLANRLSEGLWTEQSGRLIDAARNSTEG